METWYIRSSDPNSAAKNNFDDVSIKLQKEFVDILSANYTDLNSNVHTASLYELKPDFYLKLINVDPFKRFLRIHNFIRARKVPQGLKLIAGQG